MTATDAIRWFKSTFRAPIEAAVAGTPFGVNLIAAIAYQETGYIWAPLIGRLGVAELLAACVGDTIDAPGRKAFPKTKAELLSAPRGGEMFRIARAALEDLARRDATFRAIAQRNPNKFCHGFGIFQLDLQFFRARPDFFLERKWHEFPECLAVAIGELKAAMKRAYGPGKTTLTDVERVYVAIAYNRGTVKFAKGFKQGHQDKSGRFYGEYVDEYLRIAQTIVDGAVESSVPEPVAGTAPLPPPTPVAAIGAVLEVNVQSQPLRLRSEPRVPRPDANANVIARLPDGQLVRSVGGRRADRFIEVETSLNGAHFRGFAASEFLKPAPAAPEVPVVEAEVAPPSTGIVAVYMPRKAGTITRRSAPAGAHSLNEPGQPGRSGATAADRCAELATIIDWLAVDRPTFQRYQPTRTATFCNIYAHDYCHLAGVYLPRVWWLPGAIERLARGEVVEPQYEKTIDEQRANDLFRWLRDFGPRFGWRQTATLTKLQEAANLGGVGLIVARRRVEGRSGHIVAVVPETDAQRAKRNSDGDVTAPLQSQAGRTNFRYGAKADWWKSSEFADDAFWIHA
jgi:hypothetical protein